MIKKVLFAGGLVAAAYAINVASAQEKRQGAADLSLDSLLHLKISTASKYEQTISEAPASVTIVTAEEIVHYGYRTLDELLASVRGFYTSYDRNYSYLGARGFSRPTDYNDRILLLIDGHTTNENVYGSTFIGTDLALDMRSIERVEIVRGPGSALYGTGAMFAVINIITKKGNTLDGFSISAGQGSYGRVQAAAAFGKEFGDGVDLFVSGIGSDIKGQDQYYSEYDSPSTNNGIAHDLDWDRYYGILVTASYRGLSILGNLRSREKGIPTGAFDITFNDHGARTLDEQRFLEISYKRFFSAGKNVTIRGYYDHYEYKGTYPSTVPSLDASDGNLMGGEFQFCWDFRSDNRLTIGTEFRDNVRADYRLWDLNKTYFDSNFPFTLFSVYLQDEYQIVEDLMLTLGIRRDEYSTAGNSTSPRGSVVYNPSKAATIKLLYGEAFRVPSVYELNYEDPTANYKVNPDLRPESIRTIEVVWEQRLSDEVFGVASFYDYRMKNLIDPVVDPTDSMNQFLNISVVAANGVEVEFKARLKVGLQGYANYVFQNANDADRNATLTNSPAHLAKIGCVIPTVANISVGVEAQYETSRLTVYGTRTTSHVVTNVNITTVQISDHLRCSLLLRNVFDVAYETPGGIEHRQRGILQDRRNYTVHVEIKL